jgi:hypothetical protein
VRLVGDGRRRALGCPRFQPPGARRLSFPDLFVNYDH